MDIPQNLFFTEEHEWVKMDGDVGTVGISHHAVEQLGDIVFVELPELEDELEKGESFGVVESVKTVSDLYAPVTGSVAELNKYLLQEIDGEDNDDFHPEYVNEDPYGKGWMYKIKVSDKSELDSLMSAAGYREFIKEQGGEPI
ncbi:MAG: glycine cleavage system protein GcvH [Vulcanimicrobiota bacterium]